MKDQYPIRNIDELLSSPELRVIERSIRLVANDAFLRLLRLAEEHSKPKPPFGLEPELQGPVQPGQSPLDAKGKLQWLIRGLLEASGFLQIHGGRGAGKTSLGISLIVAWLVRQQFIAGKCWGVPKSSPSGSAQIFQFDTAEDSMNLKFGEFATPYLPKDDAEREKILQRLRIEYVDSEEWDLSDPKNHHKVLEHLAKFPDTKIAMFDTATEVLGGHESATSWKRFVPLVRKLQDMGIAVILITHTAADGSVRGFKHKEDRATTVLRLTKTEEVGTLSEVPLKVEVTKSRNGIVQSDLLPFEVLFNDGWTVVDSLVSEAEQFLDVVETYKKLEYGRDEIADLLGLGKSAYSERLKKFQAEVEAGKPKKKHS